MERSDTNEAPKHDRQPGSGIELRYRDIFHACRDAVFVIDSHGHFLDANPAALELLDYTIAELQGLTDRDILASPEEITPMERERLWQEGGRLEVMLRHKRGSTTPVELSVSPVPREGEPEFVIAVARNIAARRRTRRALEESELRWHTLFEETMNPIMLVNEEGRYVNANEAALSFLECPLEELLGKSVWEFSPPEELEETKEEHSPFVSRRSHEVNYLVNGKVKTLALNVVPIEIEGQTLLYGIGLDITDRRHQEAMLRSYSEELEQRVEARSEEVRRAQERVIRQERLAMMGELAGAVGHELRNPLAVITNAVYFLKTILTDGNAMVQEYLDIIDQQVQSAESIVSGLLNFGRSHRVAPQEVTVSEIMGQVLAEHPASEGIEVSIDAPKDLPQIIVDPQHLAIALTNLIANAYQAMPEGGRLTLRARQASDAHPPSVQISVIDTGRGIEPQNMDRLFEPLFTTKSRGMGLGLALTKRLIAANQGTIEARSVVDEGSVFTIALPASEEPLSIDE
jgi:PAS domain S-box-containing protein